MSDRETILSLLERMQKRQAAEMARWEKLRAEGKVTETQHLGRNARSCYIKFEPPRPQYTFRAIEVTPTHIEVHGGYSGFHALMYFDEQGNLTDFGAYEG